MPSASRSSRIACLSRMRITTDSPYSVGTVDTRISIFRSSNRSEMCPSCGVYRSAMFIDAMILTRLVIAG